MSSTALDPRDGVGRRLLNDLAHDDGLRAAVLADPRAALAHYGIQTPEGLEVTALPSKGRLQTVLQGLEVGGEGIFAGGIFTSGVFAPAASCEVLTPARA